MDMDRENGYTVERAADILNISKEAVRKRLKRGTLEGYKDSKGLWHVLIDSTPKRDTGMDLSREYIASLKGEIDFSRQELHQKDMIIMHLTNRIPQLEAPRKNVFRKLFNRSSGDDGE